MTPAEELDGLMTILNTIKPDTEIPPLQTPTGSQPAAENSATPEIVNSLIPPDLYQQIKDSPLMKPNEYSAPSDPTGATVLVPLTPGHDETSPAQPAKEAKISKPVNRTETLFFPSQAVNPAATGPVRSEGVSATQALDSIGPSEATPTPVAGETGLRIILTGRSGVGKNWLAQRLNAEIRELFEPIHDMLADAFGNKHKSFESALQTIMAWGRGMVSDNFPISPARFQFCIESKHNMFEESGFGESPDFWAKLLVRYLTSRPQGESRPIVVTSVTSTAEFQALTAAGFKHYHVVCSSATLANRPKRQSPGDALAAVLDKQVVEQLSSRKEGAKLKAVWNDAAAAHPRLHTVQSFLQEVSATPSPISFTGE